jgi:hypothetical protein
MACPACELLLNAQKEALQKYESAKASSDEFHLSPNPLASEVLEKKYRADCLLEALMTLKRLPKDISDHQTNHHKSN